MPLEVCSLHEPIEKEGDKRAASRYTAFALLFSALQARGSLMRLSKIKSLNLICALRLCAAFVCVVGAAAGALAQTSAPDAQQEAASVIDILPASSAEAQGLFHDSGEITHPEIRMTPDKSDLVRLEKAAASVIVGNPAHLSILADSSKTLVLIPRAPGATYFTVLGASGEVLMQRHVIVASPKEHYMRVRRSCAGAASKDCETTSVFYCPDMCHRILIEDQAGDGSSAAEALAQQSASPLVQEVERPASENGDEQPADQ
ncbi:MAG: pilus assembly protein N-terminal domain-containing protein [Alphaproteobacteria bacterium]|nr:pilus assembly protein N-terminal domain-containing protein [Alphaproteobacteria bacterium]